MLAHSQALSCSVNGLVGTDHDTSVLDESQDDVFHMCSTEHEIATKFTPKRKRSILLSESYERLGFDAKSERVADCGTRLDFAFEIDGSGLVAEKGKLHYANFCKDRLCPMCAWRRSYKVYAQVSRMMEHLGDRYEYLFLTLTVPSVPGSELSETISRLVMAWGKLIRRVRFKKAVRGFFRALEVTRNNNPDSKSYELYHPHFHCILAVPKSYFGSSLYIKRDEWLDMWRKAYKDNSITQVDVRKAKPKDKWQSSGATEAVKSLASAVAEVAKYSVKDTDYIHKDNPGLTDEIVATLAGALSGRRLTAFGGCFDDAFQKLKMDDAEDGDLVHITDTINPTVALLIVRYGWTAGVYKMTTSFVQTPDEKETDE